MKDKLADNASLIPAGFAIGSPYAPRYNFASDQIEGTWVVAADLMFLLYV